MDRETAARLGHGALYVRSTVSGARWFSFCKGCGWVSTTRPTESDAAGAALHHARLAVKAWERTGLPLPIRPPAPLYDEAEMRRRNRHYAAFRQAEEKGDGVSSLRAMGSVAAAV